MEYLVANTVGTGWKKKKDCPFLAKFKIVPSKDRNCVRKTKTISRNNNVIVK